MRTLVIVAHADDEALSCGGLIQNRLGVIGSKLDVLVVFGRRYPTDTVEKTLQKAKEQELALKQSMATLQLQSVCAPCDVMYMKMEEGEPYKHGYYSLLNRIESYVRHPCSYHEIVIPSPSDLNQDHRHLHDICKIALRPVNLAQVQRVLMWHAHDGGTPAGANWFEHMTLEQLETKKNAFLAYKDEWRELPHPRALDNLDAHARQCGSIAYNDYCEPFTLLLQR
jgi:LmbE family N-acetylglucosaminyl deacetylase